ncbi:MAG: hypothetical protein QM723_36700 [Myxococcaceae bacterium]
MTTRTLQGFFVVLFGLIVLAPAVQWKFGLLHYEPVDEHRRKAERPKGELISKLFTTDYAKQYEKYFNDNYGLRDLFIKSKNQIDYSVFRRSDEVLIGPDGWLDYRHLGRDELVENDRLEDRDIEAIQHNIDAFSAWVEAHGAKLVLLPIQTKFATYPEYMPRDWPARPPGTGYARLLASLTAHHTPFVDTTPLLVAAKREHQVYFKTDFHWSEPGAFIVARKLLDQIAQDAGSSRRWQHPLRYKRGPPFVGGLTRSLAVFAPPEEQSFELEPAGLASGELVAAEAPYTLHFKATAPEEWLPPTLVIGNSYVDNYFKQTGFYDYFGEARFLHLNHLKELPAHYPEGVKYVVFQFLESNLAREMRDPAWWPVSTPSSGSPGDHP